MNANYMLLNIYAYKIIYFYSMLLLSFFFSFRIQILNVGLKKNCKEDGIVFGGPTWFTLSSFKAFIKSSFSFSFSTTFQCNRWHLLFPFIAPIICVVTALIHLHPTLVSLIIVTDFSSSFSLLFFLLPSSSKKKDHNHHHGIIFNFFCCSWEKIWCFP